MADQDHGLQVFEEAFFADGDALEHKPVAPGAEFHDPEPSLLPRLRHADLLAARVKVGAQIAAALERTRRWVRWHGNIAGFRAGIAVFANVEHVLRLASLRAFRPAVAVRYPWLARASVVVLNSAAANTAAAVLAASGVL
jgi:hypothetical protein